MKNIAFVCIENSCRSLMAEAFSTQIGKDQVKVYSAGLKPSFSINENAVMVMAEENIKMDKYYPKKIDEIPEVIDILITIGCESSEFDINASEKVFWDIEDPDGKDIEIYRKIRDTIKNKVQVLTDKIAR